jgi:cell division protein FtsB
MDMPKEDEQNKERSKISMRIGEVQVELEGTYDNIKKLMERDLVDFAKGLEGTTKQLPPSTETPPKVIPRTPETPPKTLEVAPKEKTVPPPPPSSKPSTSGPPPQKSLLFATGKKTEEMGKRKIGWKRITIALVVVCILLSASVVGVIAVYLSTVSSLESQIGEKDTNIAALDSTVSSLYSQIASLQASLDQINSTNTNLQATVDYLNTALAYHLNIIAMNASEYIVVPTEYTQPQNETTTVYQDAVQYAGYVGVTVQSSSNSTYVRIRYYYASGLISYDQNVTVAESGSAYFTVLPATIEITVGNTDTDTGDSVTGTVSVTYYY